MRRQDQPTPGVVLLGGVYQFLMLGMTVVGLKMSPQLSLTQNELLLALGVYVLLLTSLNKIYQACSIGQVRVSELILGQTLSNMVSLGVVYLCLSIYMHYLLSPIPAMIVFVVQELFGATWSIVSNYLYFLHYVPPRAAVVYNDEEAVDELLATPGFDTQYNVCKTIKAPGEDLPALLAQLEGCQAVFVGDVSAKMVNGIAKFCAEKDVKGFFLPRLGHLVMTGAGYVSTFNVPVLKVQRAGEKSGYRAVKRMFDVGFALIGIVISLPIMIATALAIFLEDHGPVFYRQTRLTRDGQKFSILKFRSMTVNAEQDGVARLAGHNDSRITKVGRFIRACRVDELPQLFNILFGDMSIVGPRPERPEIASQYEKDLPDFGLRLQVKAGLTGLAQVYGRYNTDPYHKLQMDLMYINQMGLATDLKLMIATVKILFVRESTAGVKEGQATASRVRAEKQRSA